MVDPKCNLVTQWYQGSGSAFLHPLSPLNFQDGSHNWKHYGYTSVNPTIRKKMTFFWQGFLLTREENSSQNVFPYISLVGTGLLSIPRLIKRKEEWEHYDWLNSKHGIKNLGSSKIVYLGLDNSLVILQLHNFPMKTCIGGGEGIDIWRDNER